MEVKSASSPSRYSVLEGLSATTRPSSSADSCALPPSPFLSPPHVV